MKIERDENGRGKYGLVKTRALQEFLDLLPDGITTRGTPLTESETEAMKVANAVSFLEAMGVIDWGEPGTESEFFVIKLRDVNARAALDAYQRSAASGADADLEYAADVHDLANRAGGFSPFCKSPD